ncbi:MAG: hypothetical protein IKP47_01005 [Ruminococcus sp.]|nr:hypothetical protein [Ruminococcus sp.]
MTDNRYKLISKKYKDFFWPTLAMTMANNMALFVDSVLVSTFIGVEKMPAVQLCFPIVAFVNMVYWMLGLGGSLLASNLTADHERDKANRIFTVSMISVVVFGIAVAVLGTIFMPGISQLLCKDEMYLGDVRDYGRVLVCGMPLLCFIMSLSYFSRADGSPKTGFWAVVISNCVNLCMDTVLIKFCGLGVTGAALATVIGYICGSLFMFRYLCSKKRQMRFTDPFKGGSFFGDLKSISVKGIPTASSQLYIMLKTQILNTIIISNVGSVGMQIYSIYSNSLFLVYIIFIGTAQTLSPIVSVYAHEGDYDRARYVLKRSVKIALGGAVGVGLLFAVFPQIILFLYGIKDPEVTEACKTGVRMYVFSYPGLAFFYIMSYYFQAIKKARLAAVMTALEGLVFPVGFMAALAPLFKMTGVWAAIIAADTAASAVIIVHLLLSKRKQGREGAVSFLLPAKPSPDRLEFTVKMDVQDSVRLSAEAESWVKERLDSSISVKTCLALEEMLTGIAEVNSSSPDEVVDVVLRQEDQCVVISMRDMGETFNPTIVDKDRQQDFDNVTVLNKIAKSIEYDRSIGMNSTMIRISNE